MTTDQKLIKLYPHDVNVLAKLVEMSQGKKTDKDGIMLLSKDLMEETQLSYYQILTSKKRLSTRGYIVCKYKDLPRKLYVKVTESAYEFLKQEGI